MKVNPSLNFYSSEQQIQKLQKDHEQAETIFKKLLLEEMVKQMMKTTQMDQKETSLAEDFYQEQWIRTLTDQIIDRDLLSSIQKD